MAVTPDVDVRVDIDLPAPDQVPELLVTETVSARVPIRVPELPVTEAVTGTTAVSYPEGSAATVESLRPVGPFTLEIVGPWTAPNTRTTPGLPPALRRLPTHGREFRRLLVRRKSPRMNFVVFALLFFCVLLVFEHICSARTTPLNFYLSIVWSVYAPLIAIGLIGALHLRSEQRRGRRGGKHAPSMTSRTAQHARLKRNKPLRSEFVGRSDRLLVVTVPTLLAPGNLPALQRVLLSLLINLPQHFNHFHVDVITEGAVDDRTLRDWMAAMGELADPIRVVNIPEEYTTRNGARFKTRANQFAMEERRAGGENTKYCYVYHLDDDTHIGKDTAASLAEFIELDGDFYYLAQGILAFPHELTKSRFCRLADSIRPADDLARFAFFTGLLGTPLGGLHGEHLIVRSDIEDTIGWDFPNTVIEDAYFAIEFACRYPGRSTTLNSYSYGASPASVRDLLRQRRRWIEGLLRLAFNRRLPLKPKIPLLYSIFTWSLAPFQFVGLALLISYASGIDNTSPISPWFLPLWSMSLAGVFWCYIEGLKVNLSASDRPRPHLLLSLLIVPAVYLISLIETLGVMLGIFRFMGFGSQKVSEVITKPI
jgi:hypothetical protein